jgi:two-component sensor histidine kinase
MARTNSAPTTPQVVNAEADHRIANNLTMLSNLIRIQAIEASRAGKSLTAENVHALLEELALRVDTIARLHRALAINSGNDLVSLDHLILEICSSLRSLSSSASVVLSIDCRGGQHVKPAQALPIGLIAAEMMTNAIKHAHPTGIPVRMKISTGTNDDGLIFVEVEDDGVGLPEGFDSSRDGGLGFRVMRSLTEQIGGDLQITQDGIGTCCKLVVGKLIVSMPAIKQQHHAAAAAIEPSQCVAQSRKLIAESRLILQYSAIALANSPAEAPARQPRHEF